MLKLRPLHDRVVIKRTEETEETRSGQLFEGLRLVAAGANPMALRRGIDRATTAVVEDLKKLSKPVMGDDIAKVGAVSANGDHVK